MNHRISTFFPAQLCLASVAFSLLLPQMIVAAEFSPTAAETHAVRHNPDLAAARYRIEEARGRLTGSGRKPNPEIQVESSLNPNFKEAGLTVGWVQKFPKAAKLQLEKEVSRILVEAAEAEVKVAERQMVLSVRGLVVKVLALEAQQGLRAKQLANANELASFAAKRAESGEVSGVDASQFELEAQQIEVESQLLASEADGMLGELKPLLGLAAGESLEIKGSLASPAVPSAGGSVALRPEVVAAERNLLAAEQTVALENARRRDDISAGFFAGIERTEDAPEGRGNDGMIGVRVSIPLPFWNKNEGKIQEAAAVQARLTAEKAALTQRINTEGKVARERMQKLADLISKIDTSLLPKATELEAKVKGFYQAGQTPLTDVLRARDKRLQLEKSRLDALRDFHLIQASLGL